MRFPFCFLAMAADDFQLVDLLKFNAGINAFLLQFLQIGIQTQLVDGAHFRCTNLQRNPLVGFRHVETLGLDVRQKAATRFAVGVRYGIARYRALSR
jgi:hypothetical protein